MDKLAATLSDEVSREVEAVLGARIVAARPALGGYTVAERWIVELEDGSSVFVKCATDADTAGWLEEELKAYRAIEADFMPRLYGWGEAGRPLMILQDLSAASWSWDWSDESVRRVLELLGRVGGTPAPSELKPLTDMAQDFTGWREIAEAPEDFLRLGLVDAAWLKRCLPALIDAEASARLEGEALVHVDVRSDNLCALGERTYLVDWNWARRGNPAFDLVAWLPSLHAEGGPAPWDITLAEPELISAIAGLFAVRAPKPPHKQGPAIRQLQLRQLRAALPWVIRALGLPEP